jgi:para-nitrobenzyl esterase
MTSERDIFPIVETAQGRLRGVESGGIKVFKGVRYGADTAGANRYLPPQPVAPWAGVRDATAYGNFAPQLPIDRRRAYADLITYDLLPGGMGEDCLVLNLWTPTLSPHANKPVMVHVHGGGWTYGSGNSPQFDGEMLARFGDVVFIGINHRLASFGHLHLGEIVGGRFASSALNGIEDIVASLRWVKENVAAFGGDPSRVLLYGQSGGGAKTSVVMAMPSAEGLFHRAGVMSGPGITVPAAEQGDRAAATLLGHLGLDAKTPNLIDRLQAMTFQQLLAAQVTMEMPARQAGEPPSMFFPVVDGTALPRQPFAPDAPQVSARVPMMIGSTLDERAYRLGNFDLDDAGLTQFASRKMGDEAERMLRLYREEDPLASPYLLQARIDSDDLFHKRSWLQSDRKAAQAQAAVYSYLWKSPSPAYGGRYGAVHGVDIGPSLHDIRHGLNGPSAESVAQADQMASAWVAFAATGDPNNPRTPAWAPYSVAGRETMVIERDSRQTGTQQDPRAAFRAYWCAR